MPERLRTLLTRPRAISPSGALSHPLFAIALAALIVNDHALKGAGILPSIVTGKLSDVAGLLVAPAALAWILRVRRVEGWLAVHAFVGAVFTALELSPELCALIERASSLRSWADPTDLLALPALVISFVLFGRATRASRTAPLIGVIALLACTATSQPSRPPPRYPFRTGGVIRADVFYRHTGTEALVVEAAPLRSGVDVDCERIGEPGALAGAQLGEAQRWTLERGDAVPLFVRDDETPDQRCYAVRMTVGGRSWTLTWQHGSPPVRDDVPIRLLANEPAEADAVTVRAEDELPSVPPGVTVRRHP